MENIFYEFKADSISGEEISMSDFKGKVVVVVNTASKCGLTPQYEGLETLYRKYKDRGLVVLGFPCNQFLNQEPGDEKLIAEFCVINFGVTFPMFSKIDVNGKNAHPLYKYLKKTLKGTVGTAIKWNFTKFLIGKDGTPIKRFSPTTTPDKLEEDIEKALSL
ncbi:MAG: glutathione peroxidase [Deltaproteobacteria bacterium]|nr:glutathione peroxidase [Deltaproteobacteria bacterium]